MMLSARRLHSCVTRNDARFEFLSTEPAKGNADGGGSERGASGCLALAGIMSSFYRVAQLLHAATVSVLGCDLELELDGGGDLR